MLLNVGGNRSKRLDSVRYRRMSRIGQVFAPGQNWDESGSGTSGSNYEFDVWDKYLLVVICLIFNRGCCYKQRNLVKISD